MKYSILIVGLFFSVMSWANKDLDSPDHTAPPSYEHSENMRSQIIVHEESEEWALISLPPGLHLSKVRSFPKVENGAITITPRKSTSLTLPNPKIKVQLKKLRALNPTSTDESIRGLLSETFKLYFEAYQTQFRESLKIDPRFDPLEPILSVALYDLTATPLDRSIGFERRLLALKSVLDAEAARFFAFSYNQTFEVQQLMTKTKELESRLVAGAGGAVGAPAQKTKTLLNLSPKNIELMLGLSLILNFICLGILILDRRS